MKKQFYSFSAFKCYMDRPNSVNATTSEGWSSYHEKSSSHLSSPVTPSVITAHPSNFQVHMVPASTPISRGIAVDLGLPSADMPINSQWAFDAVQPANLSNAEFPTLGCHYIFLITVPSLCHHALTIALSLYPVLALGLVHPSQSLIQIDSLALWSSSLMNFNMLLWPSFLVPMSSQFRMRLLILLVIVTVVELISSR